LKIHEKDASKKGNRGRNGKITMGIIMLAIFIATVIPFKTTAVLAHIVFYGLAGALEYILILSPRIRKFNKGTLWEVPVRPVPSIFISTVCILMPMALLALMIYRFGWISVFLIAGNPYLTDTGAFFFGSFFAKKIPWKLHKINERISPNKTWEALILGGVPMSLVGCSIIYFVSKATLLPNIWWVLFTALTVSFVSAFFDIAKSFIKRLADVDDSGPTFGAMGGALDKIDSLIGSSLVYATIFFFHNPIAIQEVIKRVN